MAKGYPISKPDYSLEIRYRLRDGQWSPWSNKGKGKFESIELVQRQIRTLAAAYQGREKEVRFEWNGKLCNFTGEPTGQTIILM
jgi:hypothetical protein